MLAELDDLMAIGAVKLEEPDSGPIALRATRLLELVSGQVVAYVKATDEHTLLDSLTAAKRTALAAIVAEAAGARLNSTAAPSNDQYPVESILAAAVLQPRHYKAIDRLLGIPGTGSMSVAVERGDNSFLSHIAELA